MALAPDHLKGCAAAGWRSVGGRWFLGAAGCVSAGGRLLNVCSAPVRLRRYARLARAQLELYEVEGAKDSVRFRGPRPRNVCLAETWHLSSVDPARRHILSYAHLHGIVCSWLR